MKRGAARWWFPIDGRSDGAMLSLLRCGAVLQVVALAGCGESADASDAGCTPVYGYRFDGPDACVDFADTSRREVIACLAPPWVATGAVTCYQRPDGSRRVMTTMGYPDLAAQGWTGCPQGASARVSCP